MVFWLLFIHQNTDIFFIFFFLFRKSCIIWWHFSLLNIYLRDISWSVIWCLCEKVVNQHVCCSCWLFTFYRLNKSSIKILIPQIKLTRTSLFQIFLHPQVISHCCLIMTICLNTCLYIILIKWSILLHSVQYFRINWNLIITNHNSFIFLSSWIYSHPFMVSYLLNCKSFTWFIIQNLLYQISSWFRYTVMKLICSRKNLFVQSICVFIFKWKVTVQHCKQNNSTRPNINLKTWISFTLNHLWSCITWWPTWSL